LAELEELEQEELDKNLLEISGTEDVPLPSVPSNPLPKKTAIGSFHAVHTYQHSTKIHVI